MRQNVPFIWVQIHLWPSTIHKSQQTKVYILRKMKKKYSVWSKKEKKEKKKAILLDGNLNTNNAVAK